MNSNLGRFHTFIKNTGSDASDLDIDKSADASLNSLLGKNSKKFFQIYFRTRAADLLAEWDIKGEFKNKSLPIVWLSSEGSPNTVVARDADEFLSLIPFGTGLITRIPMLIKDYERKPAIFVSPDEEFSKEEIQKEYDYQAKQFEGHQQMVEFITKELKIPLSVNPLETIRNAIDSFPDLTTWIEDNLTE